MRAHAYAREAYHACQLAHLYHFPLSIPCVPVSPADTRHPKPTALQRFSAGQCPAGHESGHSRPPNPYGGKPGANNKRKDFTNFC